MYDILIILSVCASIATFLYLIFAVNEKRKKDKIYKDYLKKGKK